MAEHPVSPADVVMPSDATTRRALDEEIKRWWAALTEQQRMWIYLTTEQKLDPEPRCVFCGDRLGGGPGGWYSIQTVAERCPRSTTTGFHEAQ